MEWIKAHKTAVIVIAVVVVLAIIGAGSANNNNNGNGGNNQTQTSQTVGKNDEFKEKYGMSEDDIETKCQDEATIKLDGLGVLDNYSIYAIDNLPDAGKVYEDLFDKDGHRILFTRWNGKDKEANKTVMFVCYGYVDGNNFKVKQLLLGNETISGYEFDRYNKDGVSQQ